MVIFYLAPGSKGDGVLLEGHVENVRETSGRLDVGVVVDGAVVVSSSSEVLKARFSKTEVARERSCTDDSEARRPCDCVRSLSLD